MKKLIGVINSIEIYYSKKGYCTNLSPTLNYKYLINLLSANKIGNIPDSLISYL